MPRSTAHDVLLEILRNADGELTGKIRLFKTFYYAHLYYAKDQPGRLTNWPIARLPQGPGIDASEVLFAELVDQGYLVIEKVHEGPYPEYRYRLTEKGRNHPRPPDDAQDAIKEATQFCLHKSPSELSNLTHERSRSWIAGKDGDILDIYLDLIPDEEYQKRETTITELERQLVGAEH